MLSQNTLGPDSPIEPAPSGPLAEDRRGIRRSRTLKQGKVVTSNWTVMDCLIRDMSDRGARLALGGVTELPQELRLLVVSSNTLIPAQLEWQRGLLAGVRFTGPGTEAPAGML